MFPLMSDVSRSRGNVNYSTNPSENSSSISDNNNNNNINNNIVSDNSVYSNNSFSKTGIKEEHNITNSLNSLSVPLLSKDSFEFLVRQSSSSSHTNSNSSGKNSNGASRKKNNKRGTRISNVNPDNNDNDKNNNMIAKHITTNIEATNEWNDENRCNNETSVKDHNSFIISFSQSNSNQDNVSANRPNNNNSNIDNQSHNSVNKMEKTEISERRYNNNNSSSNNSGENIKGTETSFFAPLTREDSLEFIYKSLDESIGSKNNNSVSHNVQVPCPFTNNRSSLNKTVTHITVPQSRSVNEIPLLSKEDNYFCEQIQQQYTENNNSTINNEIISFCLSEVKNEKEETYNLLNRNEITVASTTSSKCGKNESSESSNILSTDINKNLELKVSNPLIQPAQITRNSSEAVSKANTSRSNSSSMRESHLSANFGPLKETTTAITMINTNTTTNNNNNVFSFAISSNDKSKSSSHELPLTPLQGYNSMSEHQANSLESKHAMNSMEKNAFEFSIMNSAIPV